MYKVNYKIVFIGGGTTKEKQMRVSNCFTSVQAKIKLEEYLKRKYQNFAKLMIVSCIEIFADRVY